MSVLARVLVTVFALGFGALAGAWPAAADSTSSFTGSLASPQDTFTTTLVLGAASNVTLQTWGFGGGTNAAGTSIPAGGFDPFLGIFSGTGSGASLLTDGGGNPFGTSDTLSNYQGFTGCPPAGTVNIGGAVCGDITMSVALAAGTYTILLSDASYIPNAVFDNGTLGEGFTDLTGGAFQTCNLTPNGTTCAADTSKWALDVTTSGGVTPTPEPGSFLLVGAGLAALALARLLRTSGPSRTCEARSSVVSSS
jgi:hypothetical protein